MRAVLVTGSIVTQNLPFIYQWWPKSSPIVIAPTHGETARLSGPGWKEGC